MEDVEYCRCERTLSVRMAQFVGFVVASRYKATESVRLLRTLETLETKLKIHKKNRKNISVL